MSESRDSNPSGDEPRDSRVGLLLADRYRIDRLIDQGAMGRVYEGEHVLMHKRVAIKVLHRELTSVPEFVARFEREAMAAANIDNEHVAAATDFGKLPDGAVFLVLEFVEGQNLRDQMAYGPMAVARVLHIGRQIAYALKTAHSLGIVHRDLKPENVMLIDKAGDTDFVKVLDFGIAKVPIGEVAAGPSTNRPITKAGMVFGTPEYMPPEQALGQNVDARADLYSLGVMLYEMLAGCRPFVAESQVGVLGLQLSGSAPPINERAKGVFVPPAVERFILKLLEREASRRPQTAQQVLDELDQHLGYGSGRQRIPTLRDGTELGAARTLPAPDLGDDHLPTRAIEIPGVSSPLDALGRWVDGHRAKLPAPLRKLPAPVLFSVPMAAAGLFIGFGLAAVLSPSRADRTEAAASASAVATGPAAGSATAPSPTAPPTLPTTTRASASELAAAAAGGTPAILLLASKYPADAAIRVALCSAQLRDKNPSAAAEALREGFALDADLLKADAQVATALWNLAQNKKSSAVAFELLAGPMGERGTGILRDLTRTAKVREGVRAQARQALARHR
jgi:serine/threonine-protein kinase